MLPTVTLRMMALDAWTGNPSTLRIVGLDASAA